MLPACRVGKRARLVVRGKFNDHKPHGVMLKPRKAWLWGLFLPLLLSGGGAVAVDSTSSAAAGNITYHHAYAFLSTPRYPADYQNFNYVNPDAPKAGRIRVPQMGTWDSFNPVPLRGRVAAGLSIWSPNQNYLLDSLMAPALDEPSTLYGVLAEGIAFAHDNSWIGYKLREGARWHDGKPITVEDVVFTFESYKSEFANPTITEPLIPFTHIEVVGDREVRYHIEPASRGNPMLPMRVGVLPILPKHYWTDNDISKTTVQPPLGSGPYRIGKFQVGRWVGYERVDDYWGRDLPANVGSFNFDRLKFDYFRDDQVQTEAVKGNVVDLHVENLPRLWEYAYDFPATRAGHFKKTMLKLARPAGLWWPVFWNLDQPRFRDVRVREALWLVSDFVWLNSRNYDFYGLARSFFHDSHLAATGLPDERELKLLEPIRDKVPPRVFTAAYEPPPNGGGGWHRDNMKRAMELLYDAGWEMADGQLVHKETREPFHIRFVAVSPALGRSFVGYTRVLKRLGITSSIKSPEISNWLHRMRSGDFDAGAIAFVPDNIPSLLIANSFQSVAADQAYSGNWSNMRDPAVDHLIQAMQDADEYDDFVAAIHALDRVLLWNFYFVPGMTKMNMGVAHWDKFGKPEAARLIRLAHIDTWWWDEERAARIGTGKDEIVAGGPDVADGPGDIAADGTDD
jgi:microcin C transport system substrate-binding protein